MYNNVRNPECEKLQVNWKLASFPVAGISLYRSSRVAPGGGPWNSV